MTKSRVQTFVLVSLALTASWTLTLVSLSSIQPATSVAAGAVPAPAGLEPATRVEAGTEIDDAVPAVAIGEPLAVTPTTTVGKSAFNVSTATSVAFESLLESRRVHVVGDSLALSAKDEIRQLFNQTATVDAESGLGLYYASSRIRAAAADPDIVVVALGTNDFNEPGAFTEAAVAALDLLDEAACVVWVDTQPFQPGLAEINSGLLGLTEDYDLYVAGWSALAGPEELHAIDGYHLSADGQQLFANLIAATVETNCLLA